MGYTLRVIDVFAVRNLSRPMTGFRENQSERKPVNVREQNANALPADYSESLGLQATKGAIRQVRIPAG